MIYIIETGEYSEYSVGPFFSTREKADAYVNGCEEDSGMRILEAELDEIAGKKKMTKVWHCSVELWNDGYYRDPAMIEVVKKPFADWEEKEIGRKICSVDFHGYGHQVGHITVNSTEGPEHAHKVCVEAYQKWLRIGKPHTQEEWNEMQRNPEKVPNP